MSRTEEIIAYIKANSTTTSRPLTRKMLQKALDIPEGALFTAITRLRNNGRIKTTINGRGIIFLK